MFPQFILELFHVFQGEILLKKENVYLKTRGLE